MCENSLDENILIPSQLQLMEQEEIACVLIVGSINLLWKINLTGHPTDNSDTTSSPSLSQIICVKVYFNIYGQKWLSRGE